MFIILNDGRKVNMLWVLSFYQEKNKVIYEMMKGNTSKIEEVFPTEEEAIARNTALEEEYVN